MIDCEKLRCLIRIELKSDYTLEYAIQNVTIAYDKIKYDSFEMLAIPKSFFYFIHGLTLQKML